MDRGTAHPPSSRTDVLEALGLVLRGGLGAQAALGQTLGRSSAERSGEGRAFVTDVLYGTLRYLPVLDAALGRHLPHPHRLPAAVRDALRAGTFEKCVRGTPAHAAVHAWVEEVGRSRHGQRLKGVANAVLRRVSLEGLSEVELLGLPAALLEQLQAALGDHLPSAVAAMRTPAPLFVRSATPDAPARLEAEGATVAPGPLPNVLAVRPRRPLEELRAFQEGAIQPQNPSSVAIVEHLVRAYASTTAEAGATLRGVRVLDVASGHGIKASQLLQAGAEVVSLEIDPRKVSIARRNLKRLEPGWRGAGGRIEHRVHDACTPLPDDLDPVDVALIDAPCSGTGTLRAHPEIAGRWSDAQSQQHAATQLAMCEQVAKRVRPGGVLLYAVCDLTLREGPDVVEAFLAGHPEWSPLALELAPELATLAAPVGAWILPSAAGQDGFYCVAIGRRPLAG